MADAAHGLWNNLPKLIIIEIFSYLNLRDRLSASSSCRAWRECLFHPLLWRKIIFHLNSCDNKTASRTNDGARFLAKHCGRFVREAVIEINSLNPKDVQLCKEILHCLTFNHNLRALSLKPKSSRLEWLDYDETFSLNQYIEFLLLIIENAKCLEHLSLGCIEELLDSAEYFLAPLAQHQACIRSLHISSVKEVPGSYIIIGINSSMFEPFRNLESLSIDYDHMCDQLLHVLSQPHRVPLRRLTLHVHSVDGRYSMVSESAWQQLRVHSPSLQVTLNLLHFHGFPEHICEILCCEMPLTHFRAYFCSGFDVEILSHLAFFNHSTLRSLILVDGFNEDASSQDTFVGYDIDPLVMLVWQCNKLSRLTVIGYEVNAENLIAISRLRGVHLNALNIPSCCISTTQLQENIQLSKDEAYQHMLSEISFSLQKPWSPMNIAELPPAVFNINVDADEAYLHELLKDQEW